MPRFFVCCHKARWSGTSGGRIAESRRWRPNGAAAPWGSLRNNCEASDASRGAWRGWTAALRLRVSKKTRRTDPRSCEKPDSSQRRRRGRTVSRKPARCFVTDPLRCHTAPARPRARLLPSARGRVSRLILRRRRASQNSAQQRFSPAIVRKTGERRFAYFSRSMAGSIRAGIRLCLPGAVASRR